MKLTPERIAEIRAMLPPRAPAPALEAPDGVLLVWPPGREGEVLDYNSAVRRLYKNGDITADEAFAFGVPVPRERTS